MDKFVAILNDPGFYDVRENTFGKECERECDCDCDCAGDCACPTISSVLEKNSLPYDGIFQSAVALSQQLPNDYILLFNPLSFISSPVVLNHSSFTLWQRFHKPQSLSTLSQSEYEVVKKLYSAGLLYKTGTEEEQRQDHPYLLTGMFLVTNRCNFDCSYCYIKKGTNDLERETGYRSIDAIFRSAQQSCYSGVSIKYSGGEATLVFGQVMDLDQYACEVADRMHITYTPVLLTNGVVLTDQMIEKLLARRFRIMVSLDGIGTMHNIQRKFLSGAESYEYVIRNINRLKESGLKPTISITVTSKNVDGLSEMVEYLLENDLSFHINFYRSCNNSSIHDPLHVDNDRLMVSLLNVCHVIERNLPGYSLLGLIFDRIHFLHPHTRPCEAGRSFMLIDTNGNISKCQMEMASPLANIEIENPLLTLKEHPVGVQNVSVESKAHCSGCNWRYICAGGCPITTYRAFGKYDTRSPYCEVYQALMPEVLRLEGLRLMRLNGLPTN